MENRRYEKYDRNPAVRRRYGRAWKRARDRYVSQHPLCEQCLEHGISRPVTSGNDICLLESKLSADNTVTIRPGS